MRLPGRSGESGGPTRELPGKLDAAGQADVITGRQDMPGAGALAEMELPWTDDRERAAISDENGGDGLAKIIERLHEAEAVSPKAA